LRDRTVSALLSLAILLLFALVLLELGVVGPGSGPGKGHLVSLNLSQDKEQKKTPQAPQKTEVAHTTPVAQRPPAPLQKPEENVPPPPPAPVTPGFIHMSHDEMASSDIGKMPKVASNGGGGNGGGGGSGGGQGAGSGPGGVHLYPARWYREPTDAEMGPYLKGERPYGAYAVIACRTIDHYHVEDCQEMEESPRGSGLARGLRQAAWQFLVWPPRVNGKPQVGEWVSIRFDFTRRGGGGSDGQ